MWADEYQKDSGNVRHLHLLISLIKEHMHGDMRRYVFDLVKTSCMEVCVSDEIQYYIDKGLFKDASCWEKVMENTAFLVHKCNERCQMKCGPGDGPENYKCRKMHSVHMCPNPTTHNFIQFPPKYPSNVLDALHDCGLYSPESGTFHHSYFTPTRHIAPVVTNATCNMSPVIGEFFIATESMQNAQVLLHTNGVAKYVVKYITKFDDGNLAIMYVDAHTGAVKVGSQFIHNSKIATSKLNEEKAIKQSRNKYHPMGRHIAHCEMLHQLFGHPDVFTTLEFIDISTFPFELRGGNKVTIDNQGNTVHQGVTPDDDVHIASCPAKQKRVELRLEDWRMFSENQMMTYRNHYMKNVTYDKVSQFSLRPPELLTLFDTVADYFRWFEIGAKPLKIDDINLHTRLDFRDSWWIDALGRKVTLRVNAFYEVTSFLDTLEQPLDIHTTNMKSLILHIIDVYKSDVNLLSDAQKEQRDGIRTSFLHEQLTTQLPIPVLSNVSPRNPMQFVLHILLSLGRFATEVDISVHPSLRESFRMAHLIGPNTDEASLTIYSNNLLRKYILEQLVYYPNSMRKSVSYIIEAKHIFDEVIIQDSLPINDIPPCLRTQIAAQIDEENNSNWSDMKSNQIETMYASLHNAIELCNIPSKENLLNATKTNPIPSVDNENFPGWDPINDFQKSDYQCDESFAEQQLAVSTNVRAIRKYQIQFGRESTTFTKNPVCHGAPGSGKSFIGQYSCLYALACGLRLLTTAIMATRAASIGGIHIHKIFCIPSHNASVHRLATLAIQRILRKPKYLHMLLTMDSMFIDEAGQMSAEILSLIDMILRRLRKSPTPFGGVLVMGTMDHAQLAPVKGLPFLLSSHIMTCFTMVRLSHSVRAHQDAEFQELQAIARMNPILLQSDPAHKIRFIELCKNVLTFVSSWEDPAITPDCHRLFSRRMSAQQSVELYIKQLQTTFRRDNVPFVSSLARDAQKPAYSRAEYVPATSHTSSLLDKDLKEPQELLFFQGAILECTYNDRDLNFTQSQRVLVYDLPSQEDITRFRPVKVLLAPYNIDIIEIPNPIPPKEYYIANGWREVSVSKSPEHILSLRGRIQAKREQYGLKHIGSSTIHKSMGETLHKVAIEINARHKPWEKAQVVVALSRTNFGLYSIVVGEQNEAIMIMWDLITKRNQWTQIMERVLDAVSINSNNLNENNSTLEYPEVFPYRVCDIPLPSDNTGYVYFLISCRDTGRTYIGQTINISRRLTEHNSGYGADGTTNPIYRPYAVAGYICGLNNFSKVQREALEGRWKRYCENLQRNGNLNVYDWIKQGERLVQDHNNNLLPHDRDDEIRFVLTIRETTATTNNI